MLNQHFKGNENYSAFVDQENPFDQTSIGMQQTIPQNNRYLQHNIPNLNRYPQHNIPEIRGNPVNNPPEIQSEPIPEESTTYEADHSNKNFLCKNIQCNHLNDVLCIVCIVIGFFLSWVFTVTFISPRSSKHINNTNFTI